MKVKYKAKKRIRINYGFVGFTSIENGWWFDYDSNEWVHQPIISNKGYSSHQPCNTVRAFRRKLKSAPKGVKFILQSRWTGYDVIGYGCKNN